MVKTKYALIINPDAEVNNHSIKNFYYSRKTKFLDYYSIHSGSDNEETHKEEDQSVVEVNSVKGFAMFKFKRFEDVDFSENFYIF